MSMNNLMNIFRTFCQKLRRKGILCNLDVYLCGYLCYLLRGCLRCLEDFSRESFLRNRPL